MKADSEQKVYASFPDTGLGNKLLIWARAYVFARTHQLELFCSAWWGIHPGSWIRNENRKRLYFGYFKEDSFVKRIRLLFFRKKAKLIHEPQDILYDMEPVLYCFREVVTSSDYFEYLKPMRNEVRTALLNLLRPALLETFQQMSAPVIGVHIRRGDFKLGSTLTPLSFFIDSIKVIREVSGRELPVTVFTDAHRYEIEELLALQGIELSNTKADVLDILLLSRSKVCLLSISSTFSFWGGFLSDGIVLMHPDEWHPPLRPAEVNTLSYEGRFNPSLPIDSMLLEQLKQINFDTTD
jgi:hypothetical protein